MKDWLDHYINFASVNESPLIYHKWAGISTLSHIIGRQVWTDEKMYLVHCNMYVNLVGPPGIAKSTAMSVAKGVIKESMPEILIAPASITKEALIQLMAKDDGLCQRKFTLDNKLIKYSQVSVFANEMVSLLNSGGAPIAMIDFMTDVWDQEEYRETTKNKGDNTIKHPFLNILGCFTSDTARTLMQSKIITGGMSRRCIFVCALKNRAAVPRINYTDEQLESKRILKSMIPKILECKGQFSWSKEADDYYHEWYNKNFDRSENESSDVLKHFLRSKAGYCMKVSMLLAISSPEPKLEHTLDTFTRAVSLVTEVERGASSLFDAQGRNELAQIGVLIENHIQSRPNKKVTKKELREFFWREFRGGDFNELDKILNHLLDMGKINISTNALQQTTDIIWIGK